jgi:hypothetical protein
MRVPQLAKGGDVVVLSLGAQAPFLLREVGEGRHEVVGECYFHGMINGEMMGGYENAVNFLIV